MVKFNQYGKVPDFKKYGKTILIVAVIAFVLIGALGCFYTVDDKQQAVVTTFGKVTDVTNAGLHFKLPFGIQKVKCVDVNVYQKIELGYVTILYRSPRITLNTAWVPTIWLVGVTRGG